MHCAKEMKDAANGSNGEQQMNEMKSAMCLFIHRIILGFANLLIK